MVKTNILTQINKNPWAITEAALRAIVGIVNRDFEGIDRSIFHAAEENQKIEMISAFGQSIDGTYGELFTYENIGGFFIDGPIIPRADWFSEMSGMISTERITKNFKTLEANNQIDTIVVLMDTPGGNVVGISETAEMFANSEKRVVGFGYGMIASAGYWLASAMDEIHLIDTGIAGSIGVMATYMDDSKYLEKEGIEEITVISSQSPNKNKDIKTPEGMAQIQSTVDDLAQVFVETVAKNRGVTVETVMEKFGQGGVQVGKKAVESGLVDSISTLDNLLLNLTENGGSQNSSFSLHNKPTVEGKTMPKNKETKAQEPATPTAEELKKSNPSAVQDIAEESAKMERERIQGCESLMDNLKDASANVKSAARAVIDAKKFEPGVTAQDISIEVLKAVSNAQSEQVNATAEGARELAKNAANIPDADPEQSDDPALEGRAEAEKETASNIASGLKNA